MIPLMVRFFKFSQHQGHGTSLMALVFTGLSGAATYDLKGSVDLRAAALLAASAMVTARFGALYAHALPEWRLKRAFGLFLIACAPVAEQTLPAPPLLPAPRRHRWLRVAASGFTSAAPGYLPAMVLLPGSAEPPRALTLAMVPAGAAGAYTPGRLAAMADLFHKPMRY